LHFGLKIRHLVASNLLFFSENRLQSQSVRSTAKFGGLATIWRGLSPPPAPSVEPPPPVHRVQFVPALCPSVCLSQVGVQGLRRLALHPTLRGCVNTASRFHPRDTMLARYMLWPRVRPSVCLSVHLSVCRKSAFRVSATSTSNHNSDFVYHVSFLILQFTGSIAHAQRRYFNLLVGERLRGIFAPNGR